MKGRTGGRPAFLLAVVICMGVLASMAASCGGERQPAQAEGDAQKYPPGTSEEMLTQTTGSGDLALEGEEAKADEQAGKEEDSQRGSGSGTTPVASVELAGARFTVVEATRQNSNADVITSGQREVPGDYYEIELMIENVGDDLVDLSDYSFRIWSEGIDADQHEEYYGMNGTFGKYETENMISGVLLDYTTLQPAAYVLKIGEAADGVFLFYDLNPKRTARNEAVSKEGTNLVIRKTRGEDAGEEAEINLSGYPD